MHFPAFHQSWWNEAMNLSVSVSDRKMTSQLLHCQLEVTKKFPYMYIGKEDLVSILAQQLCNCFFSLKFHCNKLSIWQAHSQSCLLLVGDVSILIPRCRIHVSCSLITSGISAQNSKCALLSAGNLFSSSLMIESKDGIIITHQRSHEKVTANFGLAWRHPLIARGIPSLLPISLDKNSALQ